VANNNYPQVTSVTSEALQAQIRALLPSQEGFGTDLMAQNVIVPIIDLTSAAEGSSVAQNLQTAIAFGSQTAFDIQGATTVIANTAGFWRIFGTANLFMDGTTFGNANFVMSDGLSNKTIWGVTTGAQGAVNFNSTPFDFVVFLNSGHSISGFSQNAFQNIRGSARQIADINGVLINPSGFTPQ
jgi:hypothetical protein